MGEMMELDPKMPQAHFDELWDLAYEAKDHRELRRLQDYANARVRKQRDALLTEGGRTGEKG